LGAVDPEKIIATFLMNADRPFTTFDKLEH
jgi:hypothetical protein